MHIITDNFLNIIDNLIIGFLYTLIIISLVVIFNKDIISLFLGRYKKIRKREKSFIYKNIALLLSVVFNSNENTYKLVYIFFTVTGLIFTVILTTLTQFNLTQRIAYAVLFSALPYILLQIRLKNMRVEGSYEAETLIHEIINQYKINYFNIYEALDKSIFTLNNAPYTKKLLFRLSLDLKEYYSNEDLDNILKRFVYGVNTEWIKLLSNNIYLAVTEGTNISASLTDILKDLSYSRDALEENKRINIESITMVKFFAPILYLGSIFFSIKYLGFSLSKFIQYQFYTQDGFKLFISIIILFLINITILTAFKKQKFDL